MHPKLRRLFGALAFCIPLVAVTALLAWLFVEVIYKPQRYTLVFTDHEFWSEMSWLPFVDTEAYRTGEPVRYEMSDLYWLGILCGLPLLALIDRFSLTDLPLGQRIFNMFMRSLLIITLVGSLLNLNRTDFESHVATVFVVDVSESVPNEVLVQAEQYIESVYKQRMLAKDNTDSIKLITFSKRARVIPLPRDANGDGTLDGEFPKLERHPEPEKEASSELASKDTVPGEGEEPKPKEAAPGEGEVNEELREAVGQWHAGVNQHTNVQNALRLAYGVFPPEHVKRVVLITDGNQTEGDLLGEAYNARRNGVKLFSKHFPSSPKPEVLIRSVFIKDRDALRVGKPFDIELELFSTHGPDTDAANAIEALIERESLGEISGGAVQSGIQDAIAKLERECKSVDTATLLAGLSSPPDGVSLSTPGVVSTLVYESSTCLEVEFSVWQGEFKEDHNSKTIPIQKGETFVTLTSEPFNPGPVTYQINMRPKKDAKGEVLDTYGGNNTYWERLIIEGKPRILYVEGTPRRAHYLQRALEGYGESAGQNFQVEVRPAGGMPTTEEDINQFDAVILSDTPMVSQRGRTYVSYQAMNILEDYVRKRGGGFIAIGGEQAFGLGGYQDTLIEKILPVKFDANLKRKIPSLALALVIDKSGSMSEANRIELAKDAAKASVEVLRKTDRVMVIGFDDTPRTYVKLQNASNRINIIKAISKMSAGGGTNIEAALEGAYLDLAQVPAKIKHVILLSDGQSSYGSIPELVRTMNDDLITVSTIAVGNGADTVLLNQIADIGGGRSYFTNDPYSIPRIFLTETNLVSQNAIVEEPFTPYVKKSNSMIKGLSFSSAPDLLGYVTTKKKDGAEVLLTHPRHGDPVLATWRYGLGRVTVFTSDVKNRWATGWVSTRTFFPKFWSQVVRETMRRKDQTFFTMNASIKDGRGHIAVDATDDDEQFINGLVSTVKIEHPDGKKDEVDLYQTAPGLYEGDFELGVFGPYFLQASHRTLKDDGSVGSEIAESRATMPYPYPREYLATEPNTAIVNKAAEVTGGDTLNDSADNLGPTLAKLFDPEGQKVKFQEPLWHWFLYVALLLFILDVLFRRVRFWGRTEVSWEKVSGPRM